MSKTGQTGITVLEMVKIWNCAYFYKKAKSNQERKKSIYQRKQNFCIKNSSSSLNQQRDKTEQTNTKR